MSRVNLIGTMLVVAAVVLAALRRPEARRGRYRAASRRR